MSWEVGCDSVLDDKILVVAGVAATVLGGGSGDLSELVDGEITVPGRGSVDLSDWLPWGVRCGSALDDKVLVEAGVAVTVLGRGSVDLSQLVDGETALPGRGSVDWSG